MVNASGEPQSEARVKRPITVLVSIFLGPGVGHLLVSQPARGLVFAIAYVALVALAGFAVALAPSALTVTLFAAPILVYVAAIVDVVRIKSELLVRASLGVFMVQAGLVVLAGMAVRNGVRAYVLELQQVAAGSMRPTLEIGDYFFVNKLSAPRTRGMIVVFPLPDEPNDAKYYAKRVIGLGGDRIEQRRDALLINGEPVATCSLGKAVVSGQDVEVALEKLGDVHVTLSGPASEGAWEVKPGELFVMGDNRNASHDSRAFFKGQGGGVPEASVQGAATFRLLHRGRVELGPLTGIDLPLGAEHLRDKIAPCLAELTGR